MSPSMATDETYIRPSRTYWRCPRSGNGSHTRNGVDSMVCTQVYLRARIVIKHSSFAGGICGLKLLSRPFILLNSLEALEEFDKKGAIYSQRPHLPMGGELVGYENTLVLMTYGPRFRHYRKQFSKYIGNGAIHDKYDLIDEYTKGFLRRVAKDHTNLISHIRK